MKYTGLREAGRRRRCIYGGADGRRHGQLLFRAGADLGTTAAAIRAAVREVDPGVAGDRSPTEEQQSVA